MHPLLIAALAGVGFLVAYHTYGRWLGSRIFRLSAQAVCPSVRLRDGNDYVPTPKSVVFGHHFTSIAGTGPIVGPAIAVMWGWLPALLWVVIGSIFIGAVHDLGSLVVSLRNNGQTVGDIAGRLLNPRVRLLFLLVLFMALTIVLAVFGLVIASVFRLYPAAIFPCVVQIPIAIAIGFWLYKRGHNLFVPSLIALALMYLAVVIGDENFRTDSAILGSIMHALHAFNASLAGLSNFEWVVILLIYSYAASVLPVWTLLQPRDYINSLQLISALVLIVIGLIVASMIGGAPPVEGAERPPLTMVAPIANLNPAGAPPFVPFLFITIACGAISGFHCLVSSGTSSKQLKSESDARFVGYGAMLTEGFLATLVILACAAGLGLGLPLKGPSMSDPAGVGADFRSASGERRTIDLMRDGRFAIIESEGIAPGIDRPIADSVADDAALVDGVIWVSGESQQVAVVGTAAYATQYPSWTQADKGLGTKVGAFVIGAANFCNAIGIPMGICMALMGVLVASFAGTTMDTACRLQRYVVQELAATFVPLREPIGSPDRIDGVLDYASAAETKTRPLTLNPLTWLRNKHGATLLAVIVAAALAAMPPAGQAWSTTSAGTGGMILWPLFGATNQLLGGLAFMVITFYLWRRGNMIWFLILPMIFMLIMPAWAMLVQLPQWWETNQMVLVAIAVATLLLEVWMIIEGLLMFPRVRNVLEQNALDAVPAHALEVVAAEG
jgi:carbon starvation protein